MPLPKKYLPAFSLWVMALALTVAPWSGRAQVATNQPPVAPPGSLYTQPQVIPDTVELLHDVVIGKGGDRLLHAEVARPAKTPAHLMPAAIIIHGGGWSSGSQKDSKMYTFMAAHGYFAASIEYRLSGEAKWPAQIEDCKLAVRWLRANAAKYHVDPNRFVAIGGSAGGHLAVCVGVMDKESEFEGHGGYPGVSSRVQAVIDSNGPSHFANNFPNLFGTDPAPKPDAYQKASPLKYIRAGLPPFLVFHGDMDPVVPFENSSSLVAALQKAGVPVKFIVVKGGGHDLTPTPEAKEARWNESLVWLDETWKKSPASKTAK
jgi:acetyl esterase/lipase